MSDFAFDKVRSEITRLGAKLYSEANLAREGKGSEGKRGFTDEQYPTNLQPSIWLFSSVLIVFYQGKVWDGMDVHINVGKCDFYYQEFWERLEEIFGRDRDRVGQIWRDLAGGPY